MEKINDIAAGEFIAYRIHKMKALLIYYITWHKSNRG